MQKEVKIKCILLPILAVGALLLGACGAKTTPPPETITITLPPETATITLPPETATITLPPETATITPPPGTITITLPPETATITPPPATITPPPATITPPPQIMESLSPQEAYDLIKNNEDNPDFFILDVRTAHTDMIGKDKIHIHIEYDPETFRDELNNIAKNKVYLIYSRAGQSSGEALAIMEELGFWEVYNILGGFDAWQGAGLPVVEGECP